MRDSSMAHKLPDDDEIARAIVACLSEYGIVNSQKKLGELVREKIREQESSYLVSDRRVRRVAVSRKRVELELKYKEQKYSSLPHKCPICGSKLRRLKNMTIYGGTVTLGYICGACKYWTGLKRNVPARYTFATRR